MIKLNDLRIGNLVRLESIDKEGLVISIDTKNVLFAHTKGKIDSIKLEDIRGIYTTVKLLKDFGFQNTSDKNRLHLVVNSNFIIHANRHGTTDWSITLEDTEGNEIGISIDISYIHTLQNAYYVLFNKEIDIK